MKVIGRIREGVRRFLADLRQQSVAKVDFAPRDCCRPPDAPSSRARDEDVQRARPSLR